jgi:hypothetical protein
MNEWPSGETVKQVCGFLWENRSWIGERIRGIREWFKKGSGTSENPGILILGPGGAGKSTLATLLADSDFNPLLHLPGEYKESIGVECYALADAPNVKIVVPPGQLQRREATWTDLQADLTAGKFRGVILLFAFGHDSFMLSYKHHRLYEGDKARFVEQFCAEQRSEELAILRRLVPHLSVAPGRLWVLTIVAKQDLWWPNRQEVEQHYSAADYEAEFQRIVAQRGHQNFRRETVFASLVINNYQTGERELLKPNAAGYDTRAQITSLRRLFETVERLREWEAS